MMLYYWYMSDPPPTVLMMQCHPISQGWRCHNPPEQGKCEPVTQAMEPHRLFVFPVDRVKHSPRQFPQGGLDWGAKTAEPHK